MVFMVMLTTVSMIFSGLCSGRERHRKFILYDTTSNQGSPYSQSSPFNQPMSMGQFCSFCPIRCDNGYVTSSTGCLLCRCMTSSGPGGSPSASSAGSVYQQTNPVYLSNPCLPHIRYCNAICPNGLSTGPNGCQYCACAKSPGTVAPTPAPLNGTIGTKAPYQKPTVSGITVNPYQHEIFLSKPCSPHVRYCPIQCTYGLRLGPNGCQHCACADNRTMIVPQPQTTTYLPHSLSTIAPVTIPTVGITTTVPHTLPPHKKNPNYYDPCIPSQTTCDKDCDGNYVKGPEGCQYCICLSRIPENIRTATTKAPIGVYSQVNQTHDKHVMSEACLVAKAICQLSCPNGFESAPDCLYCKCTDKTQADDPFADPEFQVKLPNPCVEDLDRCELLCTSGYLLGPRHCQFCTCRF